MSIESVMPSNHLTLCHFLLFLPSIFPSIRVFSSELTHWVDFHESSSAPQFKSLNSSALSLLYDLTLTSIHDCSSALSLLYDLTLTSIMTWPSHLFITFVSKVMPLLFNMLSRFFIAFLPRNKLFCNFMTAVTIHSYFGAKEYKICHYFHFFPLFAIKWYNLIWSVSNI